MLALQLSDLPAGWVVNGAPLEPQADCLSFEKHTSGATSRAEVLFNGDARFPPLVSEQLARFPSGQGAVGFNEFVTSLDGCGTFPHTSAAGIELTVEIEEVSIPELGVDEQRGFQSTMTDGEQTSSTLVIVLRQADIVATVTYFELGTVNRDDALAVAAAAVTRLRS